MLLNFPLDMIIGDNMIIVFLVFFPLDMLIWVDMFIRNSRVLLISLN